MNLELKEKFIDDFCTLYMDYLGNDDTKDDLIKFKDGLNEIFEYFKEVNLKNKKKILNELNDQAVLNYETQMNEVNLK